MAASGMAMPRSKRMALLISSSARLSGMFIVAKICFSRSGSCTRMQHLWHVGCSSIA